jgi:hypothetical protein
LNPEVRRAWQNALCEAQDALHVHFFELRGVALDLRERELLAKLVAVAVVRLDVDRPLVEERLVQTVQLLADYFLFGIDGAEASATLNGVMAACVHAIFADHGAGAARPGSRLIPR